MLSQQGATLEFISFIAIPNKTTGSSKDIFFYFYFSEIILEI